MKIVQRKKKINPDDYFHKDTGEVLSSEHPKMTSVNIDTNLVMMDYKEYVVIDSEALKYIQRNFSVVDFGRIIEMADMVKGYSNILHTKYGTTHTDTTLMKEINLTRNKFSLFMKRLLYKEIIYFLVGVRDGKPFKHIILNPYLARKTKVTEKDILCYFPDLRTLKDTPIGAIKP